MNRLRSARTLSVVGLVLLGIVTVLLSLAALNRFGTVDAAPAMTPSAAGSTSPVGTPSPSATPSAASPSPAESSTPPAASGEGPNVTVIGDSYSLPDAPGSWVGEAASALGWGEVVNLSSPGRGYLAAPRECGFDLCASLINSVALVADTAPDMVITFAGYVDGDYSLEGPAANYFEDLRTALPDAQLVAINPVTTDDEAPYWLTLHRQTISAAVEAVGGTFINVGQPGLGDGDELSAEAQAEIARQVIDALS